MVSSSALIDCSIISFCKILEANYVLPFCDECTVYSLGQLDTGTVFDCVRSVGWQPRGGWYVTHLHLYRSGSSLSSSNCTGTRYTGQTSEIKENVCQV